LVNAELGVYPKHGAWHSFSMFTLVLCVGEASELKSGAGSTFQRLTKEELRERVVAAAKLANAHDFISDFPQGYDTDVGSSGSAMSGGEPPSVVLQCCYI
jgi:ABC-type bacteriocin/lantibiotic exporter with double-glycine peptidase domain